MIRRRRKWYAAVSLHVEQKVHSFSSLSLHLCQGAIISSFSRTASSGNEHISQRGFRHPLVMSYLRQSRSKCSQTSPKTKECHEYGTGGDNSCYIRGRDHTAGSLWINWWHGQTRVLSSHNNGYIRFSEAKLLHWKRSRTFKIEENNVTSVIVFFATSCIFLRARQHNMPRMTPDLNSIQNTVVPKFHWSCGLLWMRWKFRSHTLTHSCTNVVTAASFITHFGFRVSSLSHWAHYCH